MFFTRGSTEPLAYCHHDIMNVTLMQKNKKKIRKLQFEKKKTASAFPRTVLHKTLKRKLRTNERLFRTQRHTIIIRQHWKITADFQKNQDV